MKTKDDLFECLVGSTRRIIIFHGFSKNVRLLCSVIAWSRVKIPDSFSDRCRNTQMSVYLLYLPIRMFELAFRHAPSESKLYFNNSIHIPVSYSFQIMSYVFDHTLGEFSELGHVHFTVDRVFTAVSSSLRKNLG